MAYMKINETFNVGTLYSCDNIFDYFEVQKFNPLWRQTITGCGILNILQQIYHFNVSYVIQHLRSNVSVIGDSSTPFYPVNDSSIDIYTQPMSLRIEILDNVYPIQSISKWSFGFTLRRPDEISCLQMFYSKPFAKTLWHCLFGMTLVVTLMFYFMKWWEQRVVGGVNERGITYEMLMVIGAYCQHIPPLCVVLQSRRTAYFVFFMFAYVIYSYYTSNLLSHLVNDRAHGMNLENLAKSDYECVIVENIRIKAENAISQYKNISTMEKKLLHMRSMTVSEGLDGVKNGKIALLSDYTRLYPYMKKMDIEATCNFIQVDLISNIKKYFFTSKHFAYREQFKISTLRAKEVGLIKRLKHFDADIDSPPGDCDLTRRVQVQIIQISAPMFVLGCSYVVAFLILVGERIHFNRYRVWPYVE